MSMSPERLAELAESAQRSAQQFSDELNDAIENLTAIKGEGFAQVCHLMVKSRVFITGMSELLTQSRDPALILMGHQLMVGYCAYATEKVHTAYRLDDNIFESKDEDSLRAWVERLHSKLEDRIERSAPPASAQPS